MVRLQEHIVERQAPLIELWLPNTGTLRRPRRVASAPFGIGSNLQYLDGRSGSRHDSSAYNLACTIANT